MKDKARFKAHKIIAVQEGSIAQELEIEAGDKLLAINNEGIQDVFDYRYLLSDEQIDILIQKENGQEWLLEIEKDYEEDLGLVFETELMDELIRCRNKCKFCFIDQLPPNMRQTVYFKDDDWRMSFLNGNYITLTNMSEGDMERLIKYRLSPLNVSIHVTDSEARKDLLSNRFAGKIMEQLRQLIAAGIQINGQIVLCKGINDGELLEQTIKDLSEFIPDILSLTIVPVGLSRFRDKLCELEPFDKPSCQEVIKCVEKWQKFYYQKMGTRFVYVSDEFYVTGDMPLPSYEIYEGFQVLDNGVGMLTKFKYELEEALKAVHPILEDSFHGTIVTGAITEKFMKECSQLVQHHFKNITIDVIKVQNHFFGEMVTVTGLLTGQDIVSTLKTKKDLGKVLFLAENMLKCGEEILLDDWTLEKLEQTLGMPIKIMPNEGSQWLKAILETKEYYK